MKLRESYQKEETYRKKSYNEIKALYFTDFSRAPFKFSLNFPLKPVIFQALKYQELIP